MNITPYDKCHYKKIDLIKSLKNAKTYTYKEIVEVLAVIPRAWSDWKGESIENLTQDVEIEAVFFGLVSRLENKELIKSARGFLDCVIDRYLMKREKYITKGLDVRVYDYRFDKALKEIDHPIHTVN
jgi:hypothetical protein